MATTVYGGGGGTFTGGTVTDPVLFPDGSAALPAMAFDTYPDNGFYTIADNVIGVALSGLVWEMAGTHFGHENSGRPRMMSEAPSGTNPNFVPRGSDADTGLGSVAVDNVSLISGGLEAVRAEDPADLAASETSLWVYDDDNAAIQQVTVGAADSGGSGFKVLRIVN